MPMEEEFEEVESMRCVAEFVIDNGEVSEGEPVYGIAKMILDKDKGWYKLSSKQKETFKSVAVKRAIRECQGCGDIIPFDELIFDSSSCTFCRHKMDKIERE